MGKVLPWVEGQGDHAERGTLKMSPLLNDIRDEVKSFIGGKTLGAILPPLVFVIANNLFGLSWGIISAVLTALLLGAVRYLKGETVKYAAGGLLGVLLASAFASFAGNAANYFLPKIISSGFLFIAAIVSLLIGRPMAAIASHPSRGWEMSWFLRGDIKPAYTEVTVIWAVLFLTRMILQLRLYQGGDLIKQAWMNTLLGTPATLSVLVLSYIYGIWRLKRLGGPGVDEFRENKEPPFRGQVKGF